MQCMIGCISRTERVRRITAESILSLVYWMGRQGHETSASMLRVESEEEGRSRMALSMRQSEKEVLILMEDGAAATPEALERIIDSGHAVVGGRVRPQSVDLKAIAAGVREGLSAHEAQLRAAGLGPEAEDFVEAETAGGGFWLIRRPVVEAILENGLAPGGQVFNRLPGGAEGAERMSSEASFCERSRRAGFAVHAYVGDGMSFTSEIVLGE